MVQRTDLVLWVKQRLKAVILRLLLWLGVFHSLFRPAKSPYMRSFEKIPKVPPLIGAYLSPQEVVDADEDRLAHELANAFRQDTLNLPKGMGKQDPHFQDPHWGGTTGLLEGKLAIENYAALPEVFRVGLFARNAEYSAVCRPNFLFDDAPRIAISRLSLKLCYPSDVPNQYTASGVAREIDLLLSEGVPKAQSPDQDGQGFFFRDGRQMLMAFHLKTGFGALLRVTLNKFSGRVLTTWLQIFARNTDSLFTQQQQSIGWAGKHYYSAGPYALGPGVMKFCLRPLQTHAVEPVDIGSQNAGATHRASLQNWREAGQVARFALAVQLATPQSIPAAKGSNHPPKAVMAAEYTDLVWDETHAPFVDVGTLTIEPKCGFSDASAQPWYGEGGQDHPPLTAQTAHALRFNAWNTLPVMRPLGQLFRLRKYVHKSHRKTRLTHSFGAKSESDRTGANGVAAVPDTDQIP